MKTKTDNRNSVEWLIDQVEDIIGLIPHDICEKALEMQKNEIIQAYREGRSDQQSGISKWYNRTSQQYFNQTFNQTKNDNE